MLASSVGAVEKCVCVSRTRGSEPLDPMGHSRTTEYEECSLSDMMPLQEREKRRGTMGYTTPPHIIPIAQLRLRVRGVGSRRVRVRVIERETEE